MPKIKHEKVSNLEHEPQNYSFKIIDNPDETVFLTDGYFTKKSYPINYECHVKDKALGSVAPLKKPRKILVAKTKDNVTLTGTDYDYDDNQQQYCAVIRDPEDSNKLTILPAEFFKLKPYFKESVLPIEPHLKDKEHHKQRLAEIFRSKAIRNSMNNMYIKVESNIQDSAINDMVASSEYSQKDTLNQLEPKKEEESIIMPPRNPLAQSPDQVYSISDVVSDQVLAMIPEETINMLSNASKDDMVEFKQNKKFPEVVVDALPWLPPAHSSGPRSRHKLCQLLAYYTKLCSVAKLKYAQIRRKDALPEMQELNLKQHLLNAYTTVDGSGKRSFPTLLKDKCIVHATLLALLTSQGFTVPLESLQKDLDIAPKKAAMTVEALGCHIRRSGTSCSAELCLPLYQPRRYGKRK